MSLAPIQIVSMSPTVDSPARLLTRQGFVARLMMGCMVLYCASVMGVGPSCMLFSKKADTLAVAGAVLTYNWSDHPIVLVDDLGDEFLEAVKEGDRIRVYEDGKVEVES